MNIRLSKHQAILEKAPKEDIKDGLKMIIPKLGRLFSSDIIKGRRKYDLPPGVKGKEVGTIWIGK